MQQRYRCPDAIEGFEVLCYRRKKDIRRRRAIELEEGGFGMVLAENTKFRNPLHCLDCST